MSILPIAAPHMEEFVKKAATKKRLFCIREHYFPKFMKRPIMAASLMTSSFITSNRIETSHNRKEGVYLKIQNGGKSKTKVVCKHMIKITKFSKE